MILSDNCEIAREKGLTEGVYQALLRFRGFGAPLKAYLAIATDLGDSIFQNALIYDIKTYGDFSIKGVAESHRHFDKIEKAGYMGYKFYLSNKK